MLYSLVDSITESYAGDLNSVTEQLARTCNALNSGAEDFGPFATTAEMLWHAGLAPIPAGGGDGKEPLVADFTKWKRRPGLGTLLTWIAKFPDANVGVVTGPLSGIAVIDIDSADPVVQQRMIERFGDTPLKTRTPSGGCHLWYQYNEEASADFSPHRTRGR